MTTEGLPDLLEPKDEGDEVRWFDDYYTIQKIDGELLLLESKILSAEL